jgi:cytochrome b subunit of formate dehydrogenase
VRSGERRSKAEPASPDVTVERNNRRTRWFHTATYLVTVVLLVTGWWLRTGHEGRPSLLARIADMADTELHRKTGYVLVGLAVAGVTLGIRAAITFVRETVRLDRGDGRWLLRWPRGALTGRFSGHRGHFDPGQRIANVLFVVTLVALIVSGVAMINLSGGPTFIWMLRIHRYATYVLTGLVIGHVVIAVGLLPGYRGAWRSMHLGGRTPRATARRLWPRSVDEAPSRVHTGHGPGEGEGEGEGEEETAQRLAGRVRGQARLRPHAGAEGRRGRPGR